MQLHTQKVTMRQRMPPLLKKPTPQKYMLKKPTLKKRTPQKRTLMRRTPQNRWLPTMLLKATRLWATRLKFMELQATMATVHHTT